MGRGLDGYFLWCPWLAGCAVLKARAVVVRPAERLRRRPATRSRTISGGYCAGETPLPIPNRAVKPRSADGTWDSRPWESRSPPVLLTSRPRGGSSSLWAAGARRTRRRGTAGERPALRRTPERLRAASEHAEVRARCC